MLKVDDVLMGVMPISKPGGQGVQFVPVCCLKCRHLLEAKDESGKTEWYWCDTAPWPDKTGECPKQEIAFRLQFKEDADG